MDYKHYNDDFAGRIPRRDKHPGFYLKVTVSKAPWRIFNPTVVTRRGIL